MRPYFINFILSILALVFSCSAVLSSTDGDKRISRSDYIDIWKEVAVLNMQQFKIPASITLAQAILESGDGNSELAKMSNNHFGIKCHDWKGAKVYYDDDKRGECFRKYKDASASFADHSEFLLRKRYASLFELDIYDYKGWAKGLKKCGYATNPAYAKLLIDLIEKNDLDKYDKGYNANKDEFLANVEIDNKKEKKEKKSSKNIKSTVPTAITLSSSRTIALSDNSIKFTKVREGDSLEEIAKELELPVWLLEKYNDQKRSVSLSPGEIIYIQPKRSKARKEFHVVKTGDTMRNISQVYGVKLKALYKKNNLNYGAEPAAGTKLSLKARIKQ